MKFSALFTLVGIVAFDVFTPKTLVSAESALSDIDNNVDPPIDSDETPFDPDMDRLTLLGLDPSIPLTDEEAAFLEETIQEVFDEMHAAMDIDLYAESVSVGTHALSFNETLAATSLRGGGRKLEREMTGTPQIDNYCWYPPGHPKAGEWRPGCEFDIDLYVCCRCWMCLDDDETAGWKWRPTPEPVEGPRTRKPTPMPTLSFRDSVKWAEDDDFFDRPSTKKPTSKPTLAPTKKQNDKGLEPEVRPFTSKPTRAPAKKPIGRPGRRPRKPFNKQVLERIRVGPHKRFRNVRKVRFGRGN